MVEIGETEGGREREIEKERKKTDGMILKKNIGSPQGHTVSFNIMFECPRTTRIYVRGVFL